MNVVKINYPTMDAISYLLYWEEDQAILIDCVPHCYEKVDRICKKLGKKVKYVLLTHGHIDHIADAKKFQNSGAKVYIGRGDADKLYTDKNLAPMLGIRYIPMEANLELKSCRYCFNRHYVDVTETPGHTAGGVCFFIEGVLFTGDTLFAGSVGRTDFEDGDSQKLINSIKRLIELYPGNTPVYPGHGHETTLEIEKKYNFALVNL